MYDKQSLHSVKQNGIELEVADPLNIPFEAGGDEKGPATDESTHNPGFWQQELTHFLSYSGGNEFIEWIDVTEKDSKEQGLWVSSKYFGVRFVATLTFIAVNGATIGLGVGPTTEDAKEAAAREGLQSLRCFYGVEEGVLMEKVQRSSIFKSDSPPSPCGLSFELVEEPGKGKKRWRSFGIVPVSEQEEKTKGKSSFRRGLQRFWQEISS
jgi:hypothetical protein